MPKNFVHDIAIVILLAAGAYPLFGLQEREKNTREFEVASVKMAQAVTGSGRGGTGTWGIKAGADTLVMTNVTLRMLIHYAYQLPGVPDSDNRISGGPGWLDSATFDLNAKAPAKASREELNLMLQPLLSQRFQLQFHWVTKDITQYVLVVGKNGVKFQEADPNRPVTNALARITMRGFAKFLAGSSFTEYTAAVDKTGLSGTYDLDSAMHDTPPPGTNSVIDWYVESMPSRLGLELKREKGPAEFFVIDHAEKPTTD